MSDCPCHSWRTEGMAKCWPYICHHLNIRCWHCPLAEQVECWWCRYCSSPCLPHPGWLMAMPSWCPRYDLSILKLKEQKKKEEWPLNKHNIKRKCGTILWTSKQLENNGNGNAHLSGTLLNLLHVWTHFILTKAWWGSTIIILVLWIRTAECK